MLMAARTAPKGRGRDTLALAAVYDESLAAIADKMEEMGKVNDLPFFLRDAKNVRQSQALLLLGTTISPAGLTNCGLCGWGNCEAKNNYPDAPCAFNTTDLGIALGSAVSAATRWCVDTRIMFSAGQAAVALKLLGDEVKIIFAVPLSCSSKSPFFDRVV